MWFNSRGAKVRGCFSQKGSILILSLWILAILCLLVLGLGWHVRVALELARLQRDGLKSRYLAKAGIRQAIGLLESDENTGCDFLGEAWATGKRPGSEEDILKDIDLGGGKFSVFRQEKGLAGETFLFYGAGDEEGMINLNLAPKELLTAIVTDGTLVDNIRAWRGDTDVPPEAQDYSSLPPYKLKAKPFEAVEELWLVKGMSAEAFSSLKDVVTVYAPSNQVNINTAPPLVLKALTGSEELVKKILEKRANAPFTDPATIIEELNPTGGELTPQEIEVLSTLNCKVSSGTFRIHAQGTCGLARRDIEVVVLRQEKEGRLKIEKTAYYYEE